eukprot:scaffold991_cov71-Phaeocystis_antarctica.AAC.2
MASDADLKGVVRVLPVVPRASGALSGMRNPLNKFRGAHRAWYACPGHSSASLEIKARQGTSPPHLGRAAPRPRPSPLRVRAVNARFAPLVLGSA